MTKVNAMKFLAEWIENGPNVSPQEKSTLCDLQIFLGTGNACTWEDLETSEIFHHLTLPAVHLAEGISADWWSIFGSRDQWQPILRHRTGFALPDLRFNFDGAAFFASAKRITYQNPRLRFLQEPFEAMTRHEAEEGLSGFVQQVVEKLEESGIPDTEVAACWSRIRQSMKDPEEVEFCEAAGALGADPYSIEDADASFIDEAGRLFSGEELIEFLAKFRLGRLNSISREVALGAIRDAVTRQPETSRLPELQEAAYQLRNAARRHKGERVWAASYRAARAFRETMGMGEDIVFQSPFTVAKRLGSNDFQPVDNLPGVDAVVSRSDNDVHVFLGKFGAEAAGNFAFARAIGSAICFPDSKLSVVNELLGAERQAAGRAFAAEFLAPVDVVMDMHSDGMEINDISAAFNVSAMVIGLQMENKDRIQMACSTAPSGA